MIICDRKNVDQKTCKNNLKHNTYCLVMPPDVSGNLKKKMGSDTGPFVIFC